MKLFFENRLSAQEQFALLKRPSQKQSDTASMVMDLCLDIKQKGDAAIYKYSKKYDNTDIKNFLVTEEEFESAKQSISQDFLNALNLAVKNIRAFHEMQKSVFNKIETLSGVTCWRETRPIENVGLYVPAGSAPLPSTVLMLGIPALIAGCSQIIICSPPKSNGSIDPFVLVAAEVIGIKKIYKIGGAQAIAAMAYGTESIPKVDKIFGPGNRFVSAAKQFISTDTDGAAIDMLAGPSEVLIIADETARADIAAYDLISQAEHDPDSQSVLVTTSSKFAQQVSEELSKRISEFPRNTIVEASLKNGYIFVADSIQSAVEFSNAYAPEHLIINMQNAESIVGLIKNAGSVFLGKYAPVTAGDYASGTNHTLPTSGTARWASGLSVESFQKNITFQSITKDGLEVLAPTLTKFAYAEGLQAHARAVTSRLDK